MAQGDEQPRGQEDATQDELLPAREPRPVQVRKVERPEAASRLVARRLTARHFQPL